MCFDQGITNNVNLVVGDKAYAGSATGYLILVSGIYASRIG